jgi:cytochrome c oxidase subunit 4
MSKSTASHGGEAAVRHGAEPHEHAPYMKIFFLLGALTIIEIAFAYVHMPIGLLRTILLSMAFFKAAVVALYYMHLKTERLLLYVVSLSPLGFAAILLCGLFWDIVWYTGRLPH